MGNIQYYWREFRELGSTNRYLERAIAEGHLREAVVLAESQTDGLGRLGRQWLSPPGGLYMSCSVRPVSEELLPLYPVAAGLSVIELFKVLGIKNLALKWPNDVIFSPEGDASEYKLAGILSRTANSPGGQLFLVVGIGININNQFHNINGDFFYPPISIIEIAKRRISIKDLARGLSKRLYQLWGRIEDSPGQIRSRFLNVWRRVNLTLGRMVKLILPDGAEIRGIAEDIDDNFNLLVREEESGELRSISSADCIHLR